MKSLIYILMLATLSIPQVFAKDNDFDKSSKLDDEEAIDKGTPAIVDDGVNGIVVNQTITVIGRDFYQEFSNRWRDIKESNDVNITITERPSARTGSLITVKVDRKIVFSRFLPPARANIESAVTLAIAAVSKNIKQSRLEKLFRNPDLGADEL